jgi:thiamine-phosphate pyrophosphorylase
MLFREITNRPKVQVKMPHNLPLDLTAPIIYLITSGETTPQTTPQTKDFSLVLKLVEAAVAAKIDLIQLREKNLPTRVLFELTTKAAEVVRESHTRLLVNDRADVALAAGASGVHLTSRSIKTSVIRQTFGAEFLIGVSTHSLEEVEAARHDGADFVVFGPVFETASKLVYGQPLGVKSLRQVAGQSRSFPVLALGGVTIDNVEDCFRAGASGVAAIRLLENRSLLAGVAQKIRERFSDSEQ